MIKQKKEKLGTKKERKKRKEILRVQMALQILIQIQKQILMTVQKIITQVKYLQMAIEGSKKKKK